MNSATNKPTSTCPTMSMCLFLLLAFFPPNVNIGQFISTPKKIRRSSAPFFIVAYVCLDCFQQ